MLSPVYEKNLSTVNVEVDKSSKVSEVQQHYYKRSCTMVENSILRYPHGQLMSELTLMSDSTLSSRPAIDEVRNLEAENIESSATYIIPAKFIIIRIFI
jgi:hypothetical protein